MPINKIWKTSVVFVSPSIARVFLGHNIRDCRNNRSSATILPTHTDTSSPSPYPTPTTHYWQTVELRSSPTLTMLSWGTSWAPAKKEINNVKHFYITLLLTVVLDGGRRGTCVNVFILAAKWKQLLHLYSHFFNWEVPHFYCCKWWILDIIIFIKGSVFLKITFN